MSHIPSASGDLGADPVVPTGSEEVAATYTSQVQATSSGGFLRPQILNRILLVLGFIGIVDASLLSAEVALGLNLNCGIDGGCATVASHPSAYWFHIPVAFFGLAGYLSLTIVAAIRAFVGVETSKPLVYAGYGMACVGALVSIYLQYTAFFVIGAFCPYCFVSALNMILTAVLYATLASKISWDLGAEERPVVNDATWVGVGTLATVTAVVIGSAILQSSHKSLTPVATDKDLTRLQPVKGDAHTYGSSKALIKITEFADLACIHCQELTPKLDAFIDQHPTKVWTIYRHFPLIKAHPMAVTAALVSEYAARKGKFWDYADRIFATQTEPTTPDAVFAPAAAMGLDIDDIKKEITKETNPELDAVQKDMADASYFGIMSTPTFFIEAPGMKVHIATASDIFDVLTSSPFKELIGK
jgi:protein-disulfide isomerase